MASERESRIGDDVVYVWLPTTATGRLCLTLNSVDGVYEAYAEYEIPRIRSGGRVSLHLGSDYVHVIREYAPGQLAVLARIATDCRTEIAGPFVLSAWTPDADIRRAIVVLAARADWTVIVGIQPVSSQIRCERIPRPTRLKYDTQCVVPLTAQYVEVYRFQVRRRSDVERFDDKDVPIVVP